ncbi:hypothetical protein DFP93_101224 [Aneurinibacillus soli]|uniref:Uncharacterized protein n=1 Tax=Aneurinibacillus soli TaxID=1500254 RepID=A0A0U4NHD4_9BACL|nr:hypothetical protein [Aneurinibacillus soli]PYE64199.1 hypothetical protein DFP93_101224 [Aneurinibacillus soli]BAU28148.1 hypothetical protein CB4_02322 [Aneurinibacillus soli]
MRKKIIALTSMLIINVVGLLFVQSSFVITSVHAATLTKQQKDALAWQKKHLTKQRISILNKFTGGKYHSFDNRFHAIAFFELVTWNEKFYGKKNLYTRDSLKRLTTEARTVYQEADKILKKKQNWNEHLMVTMKFDDAMAILSILDSQARYGHQWSNDFFPFQHSDFTAFRKILKNVEIDYD